MPVWAWALFLCTAGTIVAVCVMGALILRRLDSIRETQLVERDVMLDLLDQIAVGAGVELDRWPDQWHARGQGLPIRRAGGR